MCGFWMLLPEFFWPLLVLFAVALVLIFILLIAHAGYLHLVSACFKWSSSCCNSSWLEQMVFALWCNEPTTLYFDDTVWLLPLWRYRSVCVGFLYTGVLRLPSSLGVISMSKKGMNPSFLHSSLVNCILGSMVFRCSRNLAFSDDLMMVKVSSTNLFHRYGGEVMNWWLLFQILPCINLPQWDLLESPLQPLLAVQRTTLL